ncbi:MAG: DUF4139 domain-containing protein [Nitrospirae bacterium]|nr:DUF4139 domain-containing protein [Nitrospirota bacterium]
MKKILCGISILLMANIFCPPVEAAEELVSGIGDQTAVEVTVYNSNIGLVKDQRTLTLKPGAHELRFMDVASQIIPASVGMKSVTSPGSLQILEQNYEYDLLSSQKLLDKYVGQQVKLYSKNPYTDKEEIVTAELLANNGGEPVFRINDDITFGYPGRLIFPKVPENLISKPTLVWSLDNKMASTQKIEVAYLTNGISWKADYVLILDSKDKKADLSGWVTIENRSGAEYRNAHMKLVAGDVNRVREGYMIPAPTPAAYANKAAAPSFKEESFFEYHIYTLNRPSTIKQNQTKQISLLDAGDIPVAKKFVYYGADYYYRNLYGDVMSKQKVGVYLEFVNKKEHHLGMPLPKGIVRVYKNDSEDSLQFTGEDSIQHTPKDEKVKIKLGDAFDVTASRKQLTWEKIAKDTYETTIEVTLRNHKDEDIVVKVIEPIPGDWKILESSCKAIKDDAATAEFDLDVPKDGEAKLNFKVRVRF